MSVCAYVFGRVRVSVEISIYVCIRKWEVSVFVCVSLCMFVTFQNGNIRYVYLNE